MFGSWLGWLVELNRPIVFVLDDATDRADLVRQCLTVGHDALARRARRRASTPGDPPDCPSARSRSSPRPRSPRPVLDVRQDYEWAAGHVPGAVHVELGALHDADVPDGPITAMCGHGERAMTGASVLEARRTPRRRRARRRTRRLAHGHRRRARDLADDASTEHPPDAGRSGSACARTSPSSALLVGVNALVGGMIGQERTVLPLLAEREFGLTAFTAALTFIAAFGVVKAATNFFAGTLSDRYGRKPVLVAGWLFALPVPLLLIWAPSWGWVIAANVLLGVNQGLTWSTTVIMKIDLVGPERRGFAMGLNEAAGYGAVAITALATGYIAEHAGLRPEPFYLGLVFAGLGLGLSVVFVRETRGHARPKPPITSLVTSATTPRSAPARCSPSPASGRRPFPRAARPASSTTSTMGSPGACSPSPSPTPG